MNAVIEMLAGIETVLELRAAREVFPSGKKMTDETGTVARLPLRQAKPRWQSTLCDQDLQCLLRIIEVDLIPQVLNSFSPALHAPDDRLTAS